MGGEAEDETQGVEADTQQGYNVVVLEGEQYTQLLAYVQVRLAAVLERLLLPPVVFLLQTHNTSTR